MAARTRRPRRRTAKEHGPDPVDINVGQQLRHARALARMTQAELGRRLRMSFQLVQKYEQGQIRIAASRLYRMAHLLGLPIEFFFAGLGDGAASGPLDREEIELVRAFRGITAREVKDRLAALIESIAGRTLPRPKARGTRVPGAKG
ncbi:MAG TPA: helix-turn-helix transcriptional regulator [Stellaceae bacterium]|nr:helix-turn-helix transcriptional regulator [Stellaceae bacterium]